MIHFTIFSSSLPKMNVEIDYKPYIIHSFYIINVINNKERLKEIRNND